VPMRDGVRLFANLFKPTVDGCFPVIMSVTPYGKGNPPDRLVIVFMRLWSVTFGKLNWSRLNGFESPAPVGAARLRSSSGGRSRHAHVRRRGGSAQAAGRGRLLRLDRINGIAAVLYRAGSESWVFHIWIDVAMVAGFIRAGGRFRELDAQACPVWHPLDLCEL
jgi:hypothetical protein